MPDAIRRKQVCILPVPLQVVLPTGATVRVTKRNRGFVNVWVEATAYDFGKTEGLAQHALLLFSPEPHCV